MTTASPDIRMPTWCFTPPSTRSSVRSPKATSAITFRRAIRNGRARHRTAFSHSPRERVAKRGGVIAHLDINVVSEAPKIGPHRDAMRARIAEIAGITPDRVGVKATTNEGMGFIGRREGMVAYATATIRLP